MPHTSRPGGFRRAEKLTLFFAVFSMAAGQTFVFATLPALGRRLGFSDVETGSIITIASMAFVVAAPLWGLVADRIGLNRLIAMGMGVAAVTTAGFGVVADTRLAGGISADAALILLIGLRLVMATFAGGIFPPAQAYIAERTAPHERARGMAIMGAGFSVGAVAGPAVAWLLSRISLTGPFYGVGILMAGASLCAVLVLRRSEAHVPSAMPGGLRGLKPLLPFFVVGCLALTSVAMIQQTLGLRLQDVMGLATDDAVGAAGQGLASMAAAMILAQIALGRYRGRPGVLVGAGAVIALSGFLAILPSASLAGAIPGLVAIGFGAGLILPSNMAMLSLAAGEGRQARAAGLGAMCQSLGMVFGPLMGAALYGIAMNAPMIMAVALLGVVAVIAFSATRARAHAPAE